MTRHYTTQLQLQPQLPVITSTTRIALETTSDYSTLTRRWTSEDETRLQKELQTQLEVH